MRLNDIVLQSLETLFYEVYHVEIVICNQYLAPTHMVCPSDLDAGSIQRIKLARGFAILPCIFIFSVPSLKKESMTVRKSANLL